jgi:hypothetical protein
MPAIAYLRWLFGAALLCALATVALTIWVDPYRMYGTAAVPGWTELKPRSYQQAEIAKTYQLERIAPETLLLGNSRVEVGLDPESPVWPSGFQPVFNAALAGRGPRESLDLLTDALAVHAPRTVIVGLDFIDFLQTPDTEPWPIPPRDAEERRILVDEGGRPNPDRTRQLWRDRLSTTLSIDALTDSIETITDQDAATSITMTPRGFDPIHEYRVFVHRDGYHELFAQKNEIYEREFSRSPKADYADLLDYASGRYLATLMRRAHRDHIRLILFIHPYHADFLNILSRAGLWPGFENWKRALVKLRDTTVGPADDGVQIFDFSGYSRYSTEAVPPPGDRRTEMRWYWEAGHYKSALGDELLRAMLTGSGSLGQILTHDNIEEVIADLRASRSCLSPPSDAHATRCDTRGE